MDCCHKFLTMFQQAAARHDFEALTINLQNSQQFLEVISTEDLELVVDGIFDSDDGLLSFLEETLSRTSFRGNRHCDNALKQGFYFLGFLIDNFHRTTHFEQYIHQVKDVCCLALRTKCNYYIQKSACDALVKLIKRYKDEEIQFTQMIKQFVNVLPHYSESERRLVYYIFGKIIKYNRGSIPQSYVKKMFNSLDRDANKKFYSVTSTNFFHIYLDALSDILDNDDLPSDVKNFRSFYNWLKDICHLSKWRNHNIVIKSALKFLRKHISSLQDFLIRDYKHWNSVLGHISNVTAYSAYGQYALKRFYQIIGETLESRSREESEDILRYFLNEFSRRFVDLNLDSVTLRLTAYGFSQMVAPCKTHLPEYDIRHIYTVTSNCALHFCSSEQSDSANVENVCCYQEALSEMLRHMSEITIEKINVLVKLTVYTIKRFPNLAVSNNAIVTTSLVKTIRDLIFADENLLQRYLDDTIYDGVAWSCSHTLALDVELQRELEHLQQLPVCYKNYLPLWTQLLNAEIYCEHTGAQRVARTLIRMCVRLIHRLDIRLKQQDSMLSDMALTQSAVNQADFRVFTNLVDLYVDIMNMSDGSLYADVMPEFLHEIVRLSYKHPLISGFYKLLRAALSIFDGTIEMEEEIETRTLVSSYLANTLRLIPTFSNELLIACLYLILDAPGISYVTAAVPSVHLIPVFRIALTVGLSHLELAYAALTALETWISTLENEKTDALLCEIVPHFEPYLSSTENAAEMSQDIVRKARKVKRIKLIDTECTLRNFQRRVLLFFGSLGYNMLSSFLYKRSLNTGATWDRKDLLRYTLSLPDIQLTIHLDRILPRVILLARSSSCRHTRIAACEVLHSMIALVIGMTMQRMSLLEDSFVGFYTLICPALLALGCDSDEAVRGLYQPFTLQLMRWLSSRLMLRSLIKSPVLNSLFDGLCDNANSSLREFSGICLAEFTRWSIRQAPHEEETLSNVHLIIDRINHFALHPSTRKRVAAAVAFNHLYTILREDDNTVSVYWLEIFYCFVRGKDGCDDPSITNALGHIEKVMKAKTDVLDVADQNRRKPSDFNGSTLTHALYWLLSQCAVLDEHCRAKCMELYVNIAQTNDGGSAQKTTRTFVEAYGIERLNDIILGSLTSNATDFISKFNRDYLTALLKALDYYAWLIEKRLLSLETLFSGRDGALEHAIFGYIRNFARVTAAKTQSKEFDELQTLQCKVTIATLNFVQLLLNVDIADILPESMWGESLFMLTIICVMHPRAVGFDARNIEMTDKLPGVLENLLVAMKSRLNDNLASGFRKRLSSYVQECNNFSQLLNLHDIAQSDSYDELIQYVNGLIVLERCDMLDRSVLVTSGLANRANTIERIFSFYRLQEFSCNTRTIEYLRALMKLQLLRYDMSTIEKLMKLISDDAPTRMTGARISDSDFLLTFRDAIFEYTLTNVDAVVFLLGKLPHNSAVLLKWIEDLMLYLKQHRRELQAHVNDTVHAMLQRFEHLEQAAINYNVGNRTERLINIYGIAVRLLPSPIVIRRNSQYKKLYNWIVQEFVGSSDIEYKTQILQNFLVCLTDATDRAEDKCTLSFLYTLKTNRQLLCPRLPADTSIKAMKVINCFETLLVLLSITGSPVALDCAIDFAAGTGDCLLNDRLKEHLRRYYRKVTSSGMEGVVCSLEMTYRRFMDNADVNERLDILRGFLLPAFDHSDATAIERFFEQNIRELREISGKPIIDIHDVASTQLMLVSKIGCYQLIAIMVTRVETSKIVDANSAIVRNANVDHVQTGRELLQAFTKDANYVRSLRVDRPDCREITRLLHCSAYNCTLAILSLKKEEHFFSLAFGENRVRNELIWANIVDCNKRYQLGQAFRKYPKFRETNVSIRSFVTDVGERDARRYSYVHSYDLSTSTLNEDINAYDLNRCDVLPSSTIRERGTTMTVALESDDFNEHECMRNICGILQHISQLKRETFEPPKWLRFFINSMQIYQDSNIQLFMLKIVTNMADVAFKPYAKFILPGVAQTTANYLNTNELNYIITDVLEVLMDCQDDVFEDNIGRTEVQTLFETLADKVLVEEHVSNESVYNYNLGLIGRMVEKWHGCLTAPMALLSEKMKSAPKAAVYFILMLLRKNGEMAYKIIDGDGIVDFLLKPLNNWDADGETPLRCCECLGLYLRLLSQKEGEEREGKEAARTDKMSELKEMIHGMLGTPPRTNQYIEKQVKRIAVLCRSCPDLAVNYLNIVIGITSMNKNLRKFYCLEIFALSISRLDDTESILRNLHHIELRSVLTNRELHCEKLALQIVRDIATTISPSDLLPYLKLIIPYLKDNITEHRELVYDTLMSVYKKYTTDSTNDENVMILRSECARNLLTALLDSSQKLQARAMRFWTEEADLNVDRSKERLSVILRLRMNLCLNLREENAYALFVPLLMLQLASLSANYTENMFEPLHNCTFENYNIAVSWRRRNLSYVTPMFVDSFASQINCTLSQNVDYAAYDMSLPYNPLYGVLRATQDLQFESTVPEDDEAANTSATLDDYVFGDELGRMSALTSSRASARGKRYQRFLTRSTDVANLIRRRQIQKNVERVEMIKQESIRQRNNVKFYRSYRIGDFPDIAIPHSSLIEPLQQLIKLDRLICRDVTVLLLCSLIEKTKEKEERDDFRRDVVDSLKRILHNSEQGSIFNAAILQTLLTLNVTDCDSRDIARASKVNSLNFLGVLLLEQSLSPDMHDRDDFLPSPSKMMKRGEADAVRMKIDKWAQLVSLYKSLDDVDVVSSILREQPFDKNIQEAAVAGTSGDWARAKAVLLSACGDQRTIMREHCLEGLLEAANNLCEWSAIDELVKDHANGDLNNIWDNSWRDWMIPYVCDAYVQMLADFRRGWQTSSYDLQVIESWMRDRDRLRHIKPLIGEDLVIFLLRHPKKANDLLNTLLDNIGVEWVGLSPLCSELGMRKMQKLQVISDLDATIKTLRLTDKPEYLNKMTALLDRWSARTPTMRDDLMQWNKLAACRTYSLMLFEDSFEKHMKEDGSEGITEIRARMRRINRQLRLDIVDAALKQKHIYVAERHLSCLKNVPTDLQPRWTLLKAKIESLRADLMTDVLEKIHGYADSWRYSHRLLDSDIYNADTNTAVREHIGLLASTIEILIRGNSDFVRVLRTSDNGNEILRDIGTTAQSDNLEVRRQLLRHGLTNLKLHGDYTATDRNVGEHYYALAKYCHGQLTIDSVSTEDDKIFHEFVFAALRALYHDYYEAAHYFPCLLRPERFLRNEVTRRIFEVECVKLQPWLFLRWRDLLFSHLGAQIASTVMPIAERLAEAYPDAVAYTYLLAAERNPNILRDGATQQVREHLRGRVCEIERFRTAMRYVVLPELYLKYYLNEVETKMRRLSEGDTSDLAWLLGEVYRPISRDERGPRPGDAYKAIAKYENVIRRLDPMDRDAVLKALRNITASLNQSLERRINSSRGLQSSVTIRNYSPFLHEYRGDGIEIPGQYTGDRKPAPQYHVRIAKIEPTVEVMQSLRKPIRISMTGDNGHEYKFLVKFGEDLTIDQGLQQLYATMNRTLFNDAVCRQRRLAINTYEVIPLSRSCGLIQWVENTRSLQDLVWFTMSKSEIDRCENIRVEYAKWIASASPSAKRISEQYKTAAFRYDRREVTTKMRRLIDETRRSALRDTFVAISPSPESFVTLRRNFVTSYATLCAVHWLSGVGDRNLQNTLVTVSSGHCLGIDFGHALGEGVRGPIPELVPFRLTPQILELLKPFTERHLLATIMSHALRALRSDKGPILACMDIFVYKPIDRVFNIDDEDASRHTIADITWSSKRNIRVITEKLNGAHPSFVMLKELEEVHNNEYLEMYKDIVIGNEESKRAVRMANDNRLTPVEQVDCLLEQATDLNVLGRMYANWQSWL